MAAASSVDPRAPLPAAECVDGAAGELAQSGRPFGERLADVGGAAALGALVTELVQDSHFLRERAIDSERKQDLAGAAKAGLRGKPAHAELELGDLHDCVPPEPGEWPVEACQAHAETLRSTLRYGEAAGAPDAITVWMDGPTSALTTPADAPAIALRVAPLW